MVSKYQDFLLEKQIVRMINENTIKASGNFLDKLNAMSKRNDLSKLLYDLFVDEIYIADDLPQNWIDTDGEDTVSFISDTKADKILDDDESVVFSARGRTSIKVGRFVKSFLSNDDIKLQVDKYYSGSSTGPFKLTDKSIEEFVNLYKSMNIDNSKKFKLVKGDDIAKWYDEDKYNSDEDGTLGSSCMKDVSDDFFDIYSKNKVCSLLIYINEDKKLLGRALVWKLDKSPCAAKYFMDRIYTAHDSDFLKFKQYADEQGWMYKSRQNSSDEEALLFVYKGNPVFGKITVELDKAEFDEYPYVDTLTFLDKKGKMISNVGFKKGKMMNDTGGTLDECGECGGQGLEPCECHGKGKISCDECNGVGEMQCECSRDIVGKISKIFKGCKKCKKGKITCPVCEGEGKVECWKCGGSGGDVCMECVGIEEFVRNKIRNHNWHKEYQSVI